MAAKTEPTERQSAGAAAGFDDELNQQLRAVVEQLRQPKPLDEPERDDLRPGITSYLDHEASERKAIYDRLVAIENEMKKRGSRRFGRYLVAILIGVAATLAWQSYGESAKQIIATRAPELGWSPQAKQMIATSIQWIGWTKPPATHESTAARSFATETPQAAPVPQTAPAAVAPSVPVAPSIDPAEVHQIAMDLTALRQTVAQITASQDQMAREVDRLQAADQEILAKIPEPPPPPPIAAAPAIAGQPAPGGAPPSENMQNKCKGFAVGSLSKTVT